MCVRVCVRAGARVCVGVGMRCVGVRACVHVCVCARARVSVRARVRVRVCNGAVQVTEVGYPDKWMLRNLNACVDPPVPSRRAPPLRSTVAQSL